MTHRQTVRWGVLLLLGASVAPATVRAQDLQGTAAGTVTGADGAPLADASIGIASLRRWVNSDSAGRFRLNDIRFGTYLVETRALGYQPTWRSITVIPGDSVVLEFELKPAAVTLPEVVVSSSREEQLASATPLSIGVIRAAEIRETRARHPAELVNRSAGVYVSNFGGEVGPERRVYVAWDDGLSDMPRILMRWSQDGGRSFSAAELLSDPDMAAGFPVLAVYSDSVAVAWSQTTAAEHHVRLASQAALSDPTAVHPLPRVGQSEILLRAGRL
jgi:hypothetical protein